MMLRLLSTGIDLAAFGTVGVPVMMVLVLPVLRVTSFGKRVALTALSLYLAAVASLVGLPSIDRLVFEPDVCLIPFAGLGDGLTERLMNVLLFLPFGFLLPVIWERFRDLLPTALAGFLLSLTIELSQLFTFRLTDVNDLIGNTLGAVLGYLLAMTLSRRYSILVSEEPLFSREMEAVAVVDATLLFLVSPTLSNLFWNIFP